MSSEVERLKILNYNIHFPLVLGAYALACDRCMQLELVERDPVTQDNFWSFFSKFLRIMRGKTFNFYLHMEHTYL